MTNLPIWTRNYGPVASFLIGVGIFAGFLIIVSLLPQQEDVSKPVGTVSNLPSADRYPVSSVFAQDLIDFSTGKIKPGDPDFKRIEKHLKSSSVNMAEWKMVGGCITKFQNFPKSDFPASACNEEALEKILVEEDYLITGKAQKPPMNRFGRFFPEANRMVSLGGFQVFASPKSGYYFIMSLPEGMQARPKILIFKPGNLTNDYAFASTDLATYIGKMEYKMWDSDAVELLDVYDLQ